MYVKVITKLALWCFSVFKLKNVIKVTPEKLGKLTVKNFYQNKNQFWRTWEVCWYILCYAQSRTSRLVLVPCLVNKKLHPYLQNKISSSPHQWLWNVCSHHHQFQLWHSKTYTPISTIFFVREGLIPIYCSNNSTLWSGS